MEQVESRSPLFFFLLSTPTSTSFNPPPPKNLSSPSFAGLHGQLPTGRPLRAIELGSGVSALPCLVAARLTRRRRRGEKEAGNDESAGGDDDGETASSALPLFSEIFATDIDECLPGLEANAVKNVPATMSVEVVKWEEGEGEGVEEGEEAKAKAGNDNDKGCEKKPQQALKLLDLDWRLFPRAATAFLRTPFDVVLVADAVYISGLMPALVEAMRCVCDEKSLVFLAYFLRSESADAKFWPRLRAAFEVEHIPARSFGCDGADKGENRGLFRLRKRSEDDYRELERRRRVEEEEKEGGEQEEEEEETK